MTGRALPDLRPASDRELVHQWREWGEALYEDAADLRRIGEIGRAEQMEKAAAEYMDDADRLEETADATAA